MDDSEQAPTGARKGGGGRSARTPMQIERQERVFKLSVLERRTVRQIAAIEKIDPKTVLSDLKQEAARRAEERAATREQDIEIHLALIDDLREQALAAKGIPGTGAFGAASKAIEMRGKILGLEAPLKVDAGLADVLKALTEKGE